ncbi:serine/threonine protein kinase [Cladophialophora psammophila CBS 110553]|uniref:Serine/threonine protein kinase n=1 Tax=Cladophialophora psammophila CBS 110553 TaxID=1182543 RepID=W9WG78_9EURO|nr:serine/threonine protein kinase [Cladophialophora psammophila CBS 110553]EXJ67122.1 serine/threonine protein kinase [Cladophialophora psammophila CBS 110553]
MSTPPTTPKTKPGAESKLPHAHTHTSALTPPTSPRQSRSSSNISELATTIPAVPTHSLLELPLKLKDATLHPIQTAAVGQSTLPETRVGECPFDIEILKDERGQDAVFGTGAWSTVYKATTHVQVRTVSGSLTPPLSPALATPALVAVKRPARRDAISILKSEAKVLSHLHSIANSEKYVVPFYGTVDETTLILEAIPFSLEDHIRQCAAVASQTLSTWTMADPVLGSDAKWFHLARQLISALAWLHRDARVVHGDIKPGNILLTCVHGSGTDVSCRPVFADFSSAQRLDMEDMTANTLSAVTREYTAPELLNSKVLRDPTSTATPASDVFSMAITLLVAATGQMLVYPGSVLQRQAMATQGWMVLSYVRNAEQGSRVPRFGLVERVLERAVLKADMGRVNAQEWLGIVETMAQGDPGKL